MTLPSVTALLEVMMVAIEGMLSHAFTRFEPKGMGYAASISGHAVGWGNTGRKTFSSKNRRCIPKLPLSRIKLIMENSPQLGPVEQMGNDHYRTRPSQRQAEKPF